MGGRGIGVWRICARGERVAAPQGALPFKPYIFRALAKMLGPMRVSCDVYRRLPIASIGQLTVR